jgi:hypothetical protein
MEGGVLIRIDIYPGTGAAATPLSARFWGMKSNGTDSYAKKKMSLKNRLMDIGVY